MFYYFRQGRVDVDDVCEVVYRLAQLMRVDERRKDGEPRELSPERVKRVRRIFHEERERQKRASEKDRLSLDRSQETRD